MQDFITSGLTPEEHQRFVDLPGGPDFFAYLSMIPGPLRLADFSGPTPRRAGLPEIGPPLGPVGTFLGAPIRHRGEHVGNLYLSDKEGGLEFNQEDEDTLLMFVSQAAMAIANARRYREEQRARADLETLVNTSPVGVVVFDARTGAPVSLNREARRIVDGLRNPEQSAEDLLATLTVRRADGREISLRGFPPGPGAQHRGNHSGRGDRAPGPRRAQNHHHHQRYAHSNGGRRRRVRNRHHAGHDVFGGVGAAAGRVPGDGQPRTARPTDLHQGLRGHADGRFRTAWTQPRCTSSTGSYGSRPTRCRASSPTCWTWPASTPEPWRWPQSLPMLRSWWTGPGTPS